MLNGNRKFIAFLLTLIISSVLVYLGTLDDGVYENIVIFGMGLFIAGNGAEYFAARKSNV